MKIKLLILLVASQFSFAQERNCGTPDKMRELSNNPEMKAVYEENMRKFQAELARNSEANSSNATMRSAFRIPVAVHYPSANGLSESEKQCLRDLAQNQVNILNADFNGTNADISTWINTTSSYFPGVNYGSMNVNFEIASGDHPASTGLTDGTLAVTFGEAFGGGPNGDWDPDWNGYLNFVVKNLSGGVLGYAYLASSPANGAAVYIDNGAFGAGAGCVGFVPGAPYNLGRTLTHELGHYLNLEHIWGDATCGSDGVADTPLHNTSNGGCPAISHLSTCTGTPRELTMNYMDYTNDVCMYMLTQGQAARMQTHLNTIQGAFNQSTLSNENFGLNNRFVVYPNPNKGSFNVQFDNLVTDYSIQVMDRTGRIVFKNEYVQNQDLMQKIQLDTAASGIYFVTIKTDNAVATKRVIVE
ncbi:zinc-dependent metalloprotease [Flavobacterium enshiense]|uniref:zinc-dependent metalloprotease n=1 Tax=Flavobacterium enshiense TaxID=1341165 RepID=UPI00345D25F7